MLTLRTLPRAVALSSALVVALLAMLLVSVAPAFAEVPWWNVTSTVAPRNLPPGGEGKINVTVGNLGDATANGAGSPVSIVDKLPPGVTAIAITPLPNHLVYPDGSYHGTEMTCSLASLSCTYAGVLEPYDALGFDITVKVAAGAMSGEENEVQVVGGGATSVQVKRPLTVTGKSTPFGVENYELTPENEGGSLDTQAGSHPFQLTTTLALNQTPEDLQPYLGGSELAPTVPALAKDLHFDLPPGLIGNPTPFPQCTNPQFEAEESSGALDEVVCPLDTVVGVASVTADEPREFGGVFRAPVPLYNLVPGVGEPARFGFVVAGIPVILDTSVQTGGDYGVVVSVNNISEIAYVLGSQVTFWGVPGDPRHNQDRGRNCMYSKEYAGVPGIASCTSHPEAHPAPLLTLPTSCTGSLRTSLETDSWAQSGVFTAPLEPAFEEALDGCNHLGFEPSISVAPDVSDGSTPTGLTVDVHVPQEESLNPTGLAEADVKDTTVTLPAGVTLDPAGANDLEACSESQVGFEGFTELNPSSEPGVKAAQFTAGEASCPPASKIATAVIHSPLLPNPLEGEVYLAAQGANPFGSLVAMYLVARDPVSGVLVKLPGEVSLNQETGQITSTFLNTPQLPFEDLELHFFGGERAPLSTPAHCGAYTTNASFAPWSGNEAVDSTSSFEVTSGPNGGPCPGASLPFAATFTGGTTNIQAGAFSTIDTVMSREDGNQNLQGVQLHFPQGFTGLLSGVNLCGEAQANAGTCGPESEIGETTVSVGLGGDPYTVTGGKVYITGPYEGAPFGLSIVNPAVAGPYNLGKVVVRAKIEVNPTTAALTITTDNSGPYKIPSILDGIPLQIKHVSVTVDRPDFTINPTSCTPAAITGTLTSAEGSTSPLSVPFQVANCANLKFEPRFAVSTSGKTSKADGASLTAKVSEPNSTQGTQANIAKVKVELPKALPSRLTTLQKACTSAQFESNPAACPSESKIGYAVVHTPLLPVPLEGPAIFVSHGGEAFPSLTLVLQGDGVTIDLVGATYISKAGVTSTTFKTVPDAPFSTFALTLPEGPYSALAANGNLCRQKLVMPSEFIGQNGAEIHESTSVEAEGCSGALQISSHKVKSKTLTVKVYVPAAGKVVVSGRGLHSKSKTAKGRETLTISVSQERAGKLKTTVKVVFTPSAGKDRKKQTRSAKVAFKRARR